MSFLQKAAALPDGFWAPVFFLFGTIVGSFLNVCIHRMPRGESIVSPPSRCPHCGHRIPWTLNLPVVTWLYLRGKCRHCQAAISPRYVGVELLTGLLFLASWEVFGARQPALALAYCLLFALFIVATFIDFEHYIIPDEITLGGVAAGFLCSFLVPMLQHANDSTGALRRSFLGIVIGGGLVYAIVRGGKLLFGRQRFAFPPDTRITFTETTLQLPDREVPYEELFYRKSDTVVFRAQTLELYLRVPAGPGSELNRSPEAAAGPADPAETAPTADPGPAPTVDLASAAIVEPVRTTPGAPESTLPAELASPPTAPADPGPITLPDRTYQDVLVRLQPHQLSIGEGLFNPEEVLRMVAVTGEIVVPREAMGFGDVKFMASIGAFLGAPAALFSLLLSAMIGSLVGVALIAVRRREWSSRLPYGPYIALAASLWVFGDTPLYDWWVGQLNVLLSLFGARI